MKTKLFVMVILLLGFTYGCSELFKNDDTSKNQMGSVTISLTDAPFPYDLVEAVNITIDKISFKILDEENTDESAEETENESDFIVLVVDEKFNLLELGNGESEILGALDIPAGEYSEIRMHVTDAKIKLKDVVEEMDIKIPSAGSSGLKIKIKPALVVTEGEEYQLLLDFDVSRSFIAKGNNDKGKEKEITGFIFKPVIRAVNIALAGELSGIVEEDDDNETIDFIKNAHIYIVSPDDATDTIATGKTDKEGFYKIIGIPGGAYNVSCEKEGYEITEPVPIEVIEGEITTQDFRLKKVVETEETTGTTE